ncbi:MAG: hypothetical protein KKA28_18995 [Planctomycetes bacterium]|nr:hypothetical protein [Planctomycetota bacterium]MCG2682375.1 hypothetical protein [Planctomycetales bacterium]
MRLLAKPVSAALLILLLLARLSAAVEPAPAKLEGDKAKRQFLRLKRDQADRPLSLDTAIVRCAPVGGDRRTPTVDLVAAVHIADPEYYRQLNREFSGYDAVLYELVATDESKTPRPESSIGNHPISLLQSGMKNLLELEFQLKGIDYTRKNMVHADMSPEQFARSMRQRGESMTTMFARMLGYALSKPNQSSVGSGNAQLLAALFDKNRELALKRILAEQFTDSDDVLAALDGPAGSTLISGRNQVALDVLKKELDAGKKKIAIFYGAGHMPDLLRRLRDDFALAPVSTRWLVAWDLEP